MDALNEKGFGVLKGHLEVLFKDMAGGAGGGLSADQYAKISGDNEELKAALERLGQHLTAAGGAGGSIGGLASGRVDGLGGTFSKSGAPQWSARLQPPVPRVNPDSTVTRGYSHRFAVDLLVTSRHGEDRTADAKELYDNAFLQVQLQECFELIKRKDEALKSQKREIDTLYSRIKKYLLMQDHLYKDFVKMEDDHAKVVEDRKLAAKNANEALSMEQMKVKRLEALGQGLEKAASSDDLKARLVEHTKQNSLLEVNLIRMTRKYQTLEEQEKLLRRNY